MTEIKFHIGASEINGSEYEIIQKEDIHVAGNSKGMPLMIDNIIKEDSPLGNLLRKLIKKGGYSLNFQINIDISPMTKSKMKRLKRKHREENTRYEAGTIPKS